MDTIDTQSWIVLGIIALIVGSAAGGWIFYVEQRMSKLRQAFGPDYSRIADQSAMRTRLSHS